jgi:hypothetical protein
MSVNQSSCALQRGTVVMVTRTIERENSMLRQNTSPYSSSALRNIRRCAGGAEIPVKNLAPRPKQYIRARPDML